MRNFLGSKIELLVTTFFRMWFRQVVSIPFLFVVVENKDRFCLLRPRTKVHFNINESLIKKIDKAF